MVRECEVQAPWGRMRYLEAGMGWPVMLIHAFPLGADMWRPQLERVPDGWRYLAPDLRGFGPAATRALDTRARSLDDYAADLVLLLDHLEIDRATIGGLSMGGYITFALFRKAPERFSALILADTRPQADTPEGREGRRKLLHVLETRGAAGVADEMLPKLLGTTSREERPAVVAWVRRVIEANPPEGIGAAIEAMMERPDSTRDLSRLARPTLVIAGEEDVLTPVADAEALQRQVERSRLVTLPRAGHLSSLETPEEFSRALSDFLGANL
jgi:pimeloyl-ACP methyl ester carboxylesterase